VQWLKNTRRAQQRLSFCRLVVDLTGPVRTASETADDLRAVVNREFVVPADRELIAWIQDRRGSLGSIIGDSGVSIQIQAWYLFRYRSQSGWLSPKGVDEYVEGMPRQLGLVDEVFRVTEAGQILREVLGDERDRRCWEEPCTDHNPMELTPDVRYFLAHAVVSADGDFLIPWVHRLVQRFGSTAFSYLEAGMEIPSVLETMVANFEPVAYLVNDRQQLLAADSARARIETEISTRKEKEGSGSRRDQTSVPRLEWLLDLGILTRVDPSSLSYRFTPIGRDVAARLGEAYQAAIKEHFADTALQRVLDESFATASGPLLEAAETPGADRDVLAFLRPAFEAIDSISGYCLLRTLNLTAAVFAARNGTFRPIEYATVVGELEQTYKDRPGLVEFTVDRLSTDYQVKLLAAPD
jgi:hypothetical protein